MEHQWMKSISSETICNFFYFFFVFYAAIAVVALFGGIMTISSMPKSLMLVSGFQNLVVFALAATAALFHYLICDRALLAKAQVQGAQGRNPDMLQ